MASKHTKINDGSKTGADKAAEHLPALTRAYGRTLRAAGRRAAGRMRQIHPITAAADQQPPNWTPPPAGQLIDQQELEADTQRKTAKLHRQMLTASASSAMQPFDISFDIHAPTSQAILDAIAARIQGTITSAIEEQITEAIQEGFANGYSVDRVARNIVTATDKISKVRADMLARTDLNALSNAGSLLGATTADAASTKTWLATEDERTRETHADADGQTVAINDTFTVGGESAQYPGDPDLSWEESANCFPGETLVAAASFAGGFRRWYDGDLILVETDAEHRLSGTPNHPVLTSAGWKALGDLEHGDYLVCGALVQEEAGVDPDVDHVPTKIEEVFAALDVVGDARRIPGSNVNFHGEIPDREVDVVGANGLLRNERDPASTEPFSEHHLTSADVNLAGLLASGASSEVFGAALHATDGVVGGGAHTGTLLRSRPRHPSDHALGAIARLNAELEQTAADYGTADIVELGERLLGFPCEVALAKIVKRDVLPFHGFVYNLQVGGRQSYLAGSVIAHNCRCTVVYGQPLTASAALARFRDHLWEGSFDYDLIAKPHADALTSGGNMPAIDVATLTHEEREELAAKLAEPLSPEATRFAEVRSALAAGGFGDAFDDEQLAALILVSEALGLSPTPASRAPLTDSALLAAAAGGTPWTATLCVAGVPTVDSGVKRLLSPDGGSWLPLPLPLMLMEDGPHADVVTGAPICGRIDSISVAGNQYQANGVLFDDSDDPDLRAIGSKAAALVGEMRRLGISIDMVDCEWEPMAYDASSVTGLDDMLDEVNDPTQADEEISPTEAGLPNDMPIEAEQDVEAEPDFDDIEIIMVAKEWTIAGATICPVQALAPQSTISLIASAAKRQGKWNTETDIEGPVLTASAAGLAPERPPAEWFENPELGQLTALTVTEEGRVYGHMAPWDGCHTGFPGRCVPPPRSPSGYEGFHLGEIKTAEGKSVAVGTLTMDTGHAGLRLSADKAVAHYDNTGTAAAFVRAGEDAFGIWVAGTISARLSAADAQALMASKPSGDWREVFRGKGKDLIGVLQVNVPGFPVPRALTASGLLPDGEDAVQFVESAACQPCEEALERELAVLAASADGIEGLAALVA